MDRLGGFFGSREAEEDCDDDYVEPFDADIEPPPSPVGQDERRMQVRAYNHWAGLLGDLNFPPIADLEPGTLKDFGPYSVLLDLSDDVEDPKIGFVGAELAAECGPTEGLVRLSEVPSRSVLSRITDHYMQILANEAPIGFEAEFVNETGASVLYRGILLPYSSDNATIDFIYGVINWKEMADRETADALLLELDQALGTMDEYGLDGEDTIDTVETLAASTHGRHDRGVLELGDRAMMDSHGSGALPRPAFGPAEEHGGADEAPGRASQASAAPRMDALGNPVGTHVADDEFGGADDDFDDFDSGMKTAADYGLPEWDEDEEDEEDVDGVVDPLADEDTASSLVALVSRGERTKKTVLLSRSAPVATLPHGYGDEEIAASPRQAEFDAERFEKPTDPVARYGTLSEAGESGIAAENETVGADAHTEPAGKAIATNTGAEEIPADAQASPEGLYDCLAAAREMAQTAQNTEDRSRKALYAAVGRAYDFSLEAQQAPDDFDELLNENGLTFQDRAPMTPVVKLVFGADYDKTRLTEYAAVLMHAHRVGVERGKLTAFLREAEGGLKGVVQAERRARKEEQGKPVADEKAVRPALAGKLRALDPLSLAELDEEGAEFALVMVRRTPEGALEIIGEVPEDIPLVERAARKLLG